MATLSFVRLPITFNARSYEIPASFKDSYSIKHALNFAVQLIGNSRVQASHM
jgi:hypothetical protein